MALAINTSHPLYADVVALIAVQDDNTVVDLTGNNACTPNGSVTFGTGTYGRHFATARSGSDSLGVALSPGFATRPATGTVAGTTFVVINVGTETWGRPSVLNTSQTSTQSPCAVDSGAGAVAAIAANGSPLSAGTTTLIGTGAHSFGLATNASAHKVFADGAVETTGGALGSSSDSALATYIGGNSSGSYGSLRCSYVYVVHFRKYLSDIEISDLHASLGASNVFGLVTGAGAPAPDLTGSATLDGITASGSMATLGPSTLTGSATLDDIAAGGALGVAGGTFTSEPLTRNTAVFPGATTLSWLAFRDASSGAPVGTVLTGVAVSAGGIFTVAPAFLVPGTTYLAEWLEAGGQRGYGVKAAA